ncbi:alpha/beta-hydrolase [Mytilinidion resinicola]|uniref:feruloyl esterase n=1 Tax=Mytilinidion resinicola TaxID=574789 RepID=A0A6A6XZZ5_9PEZI|nr:alpha/beta-hydrolase [Mytilinidion resinicola]KAF2802131.1 alpha/beta-hydrolase [Mytilinidion resinicola]
MHGNVYICSTCICLSLCGISSNRQLHEPKTNMKLSTFFLPSLSLLVACAQCASQTGGCGQPLPTGVKPGVLAASNTPLHINSGNRKRTYLVHVPEKYDVNSAVPLILSFHGRAKTATEQEGLSQFSNSSYNPDGIAVYPEGVPDKNGTQQWTGDPDAPADIDDILFTSDLIDHLLSRYCIDPSRVYAAGKSNGGGLVGLLACDVGTSSKIAAFAAVSGAFYLNESTGELPPCKPARVPIPILETHGLKDHTINYTGGPDASNRGDTIPIVSWVDDWATRDGFEVDTNKTTTLCGDGARTVKRYNWEETVLY